MERKTKTFHPSRNCCSMLKEHKSRNERAWDYMEPRVWILTAAAASTLEVTARLLSQAGSTIPLALYGCFKLKLECKDDIRTSDDIFTFSGCLQDQIIVFARRFDFSYHALVSWIFDDLLRPIAIRLRPENKIQVVQLIEIFRVIYNLDNWKICEIEDLAFSQEKCESWALKF